MPRVPLASSSLAADNPWGDARTVDWVEEPVPLTRFVTDRRYLGNPLLSPEQYEAVRHAERVYFPHTYLQLAASDDPAIAAYWGEPCRMVHFLELEWGKGGGKDHICRVSCLRIAYLLLCLPSPQRYYDMPEQDTIHLLNVASSSKQAWRAFFKPMREMVSRPGGWFEQQGVVAVEAGQNRGRARREGGAQVLQDTIRFPKNVEAISGHSDAEAQEGLNLLLGIADEIDAFKRSEELARYHAATARGESTRSAEAILDLLRSSARTRYPDVFKNIHISWPRYLGSMIQTLVERGTEDIESRGQASEYYVSGPHASWEVNPRLQKPCLDHGRYTPGCQNCWDACKALFADDYEKDPALSRARYEARPSRAINPYFSNEPSVKAAFQVVERPPVDVSYLVEIAGRAWRPVYDFGPGFFPVRGAQYAIHGDLAISGDRAGICIAHTVGTTEVEVTGHSEDGRDVAFTELRPVVKVDALFAYTADKRLEPPREIQIRWMRPSACSPAMASRAPTPARSWRPSTASRLLWCPLTGPAPRGRPSCRRARPSGARCGTCSPSAA
jgi:hypothetical protein